MERFIEDQAFSPWNDLAPSSPSPVNFDWRHIGRLRKRDDLLMGEGEARRLERSKIIGRRESLDLYKSFNNLWFS
jgi:hypothetical protein